MDASFEEEDFAAAAATANTPTCCRKRASRKTKDISFNNVIFDIFCVW